MSQAKGSAAVPNPLFDSYAALALGLVPELDGVGLLDEGFELRGRSGGLDERFAAWVLSLDWEGLQVRNPAASEHTPGAWWIAMPVQQSDGTLLGVFGVSRPLPAGRIQAARLAADLALRLKPLLDCVHRDLAAARPSRCKVAQLTERTAELEWLFRITSNLKGAVDDQRVIEDLLSAATARLDCAFGILCIPDKRLTMKCARDSLVAPALAAIWGRMEQQLIGWVQRHNKPLVMNGARRDGKLVVPCKILCVPIVKDSGRVSGALAFFNPTQAVDFQPRHVFLARHIGRQAAALVEAQFDLMTGLYTRSGLDQMYRGAGAQDVQAESSVIYLDIDHMHMANEMHGFELGNELIVRVATTWPRRCCRRTPWRRGSPATGLR